MTTKLYTDVDLTEPNYAAELALIGVTGALHYAPYGTPLALNMAQYEKPHVDFGCFS